VKTKRNKIVNLSSFFVAIILFAVGALAPLSAAPPAAQQPPEAIERQVENLLSKLTLDQKVELLGGEDSMFTHALPSIGLPRMKMSDGPMGVRTWGPSTGYAAGVGLAASWDINLARQVGVSLGQDARARGVNFLLGPGMNIYRAPMNGRNFEYLGEDPYLAGQIAAHYILGVQSQGVVATAKHYDANNSEYDRHDTNAVIDERTLREIYLPAFEAAVKEGHVGAVMDSYNLLNGEHATQNKFLNLEVLKKDWGFKGILMSDWVATYDGVAAANGGLDLEMPSAQFMNVSTLLPAVQDGRVSEATINDKVRRILRVAIEYGFLKNDQQDVSIPLDNPASRKVALQSSEEGMLLLKNDGNLLPLDLNTIHTIALIGPNAFPAVPGAGGSSQVTAFDPVSFLSGLNTAFAPQTKVLWSSGVRHLDELVGSARRPSFGPPTSSFSVDLEGKKPGLRQEEFEGDRFSDRPDRVSTVMSVRHWGAMRFGRGGRKAAAMRWSGFYTPPKTGPTAFITASSGRDSYKLYVNHKLVLDAGPGEGQPRETVLDLPEGKPVAIRMDYSPDGSRITAGLAALPQADLIAPNVQKIASMADVAIVSVGFTPATESEGHDRTYRLPPGQEELIQEVAAANPRTIVVVTSGGSVATADWLEHVPALLETWYAGSEGGRALASILSGQTDPSGRLPFTWWRTVEDNPAYKNYYEPAGSKEVKYTEGIFLGYRAVGKNSAKPLFPFGYGLSYTTFAFSNLKVKPNRVRANESVTVTFEVRNTGRRAGATVAQVYVGDPSASVPRPEKELRAFQRVELQAGAKQQVTLKLDMRSFAYWDTASHDWKVDPGKFVVYVGDSSANVPLEENLTVR
jgi:beta-glucosidase